MADLILGNSEMLRILLCPNAFKSSLTAAEAIAAIEAGISRVFALEPNSCVDSDRKTLWQPVALPMADGGDGTMAAIVGGSAGSLFSSVVRGPLGKPVHAHWGRLGEPDEETAVIEMAEAAGLRLLTKQEYNPLLSSTYGVGQLIKAAVEAGCEKIVIGIGGSATNDGGAGMAQALGIRLLDSNSQDLPPGGAALKKLSRIEVPAGILPQHTEFIAACDVNNPLCGPQGASAIYGPQKGADAEMVKVLDDALCHYADIIKRDLGLDIANIPGAGAAGGLGAGLMAFCGARLESGVDLIMDLLHFDEKLDAVDLVITGEGRLDSQTSMGKVIAGVAKRAKIRNIPVLALVGSIEKGAGAAMAANGLTAALSITDGPLRLEEAIRDAYQLLADTSERAARLLDIDLSARKRESILKP